jgi:hypothetical protein
MRADIREHSNIDDVTGHGVEIRSKRSLLTVFERAEQRDYDVCGARYAA